ncbi:hypothetical protein Zm00014a_041301 [Zea mays]|uniref:Uncharacterized protein n=1 Tax=Zea mays TaxID=4577 RepID=A0A3L6FMY5_MAIZE|nr:hypothetical protein Zm00014a_041301 [Zea mays]
MALDFSSPARLSSAAVQCSWDREQSGRRSSRAAAELLCCTRVIFPAFFPQSACCSNSQPWLSAQSDPLKPVSRPSARFWFGWRPQSPLLSAAPTVPDQLPAPNFLCAGHLGGSSSPLRAQPAPARRDFLSISLKLVERFFPQRILCPGRRFSLSSPHPWPSAPLLGSRPSALSLCYQFLMAPGQVSLRAVLSALPVQLPGPCFFLSILIPKMHPGV